MLALDHEAGDYSVKGAALVSQGLSILAHPMLARAQLPEVLSRCRHGILVQLKNYSAPLVLPKGGNVKVYPGPIGPGRFLQVLPAMSAVTRAGKPGVVRSNALYVSFMLMGGLKNAGVQCASTLLGTAIGSGCPVCCAWPGRPSLRDDVAMLALPDNPIPSVGATVITGMRNGPHWGEMYVLGVWTQVNLQGVDTRLWVSYAVLRLLCGCSSTSGCLSECRPGAQRRQVNCASPPRVPCRRTAGDTVFQQSKDAISTHGVSRLLWGRIGYCCNDSYI